MSYASSFTLSGLLKNATPPEQITFANGNTSNKFVLKVTNTDNFGKENVFYVEVVTNEAKIQMFNGCLAENQPITITGELVSAPYMRQGQEAAFLRLKPNVISFPQLGRQIELRGGFTAFQNGTPPPKLKPLAGWGEDDRPPF